MVSFVSAMMLRTDQREVETLIKLLMVGDSGVGKSSLLTRFVDDSFNPSFVTTIGIDFRIRILEVDGVHFKLQVWDTAGQERFRSITAAFYRGAMGVLLAYDSTNPQSFAMLPMWMETIRARTVPDACLMLIATKCDKTQESVVSAEQGRLFAAEHDIMFIETSAKDNINVGACFTMLTTQVIERFFPASASVETKVVLTKSKTSNESVNCCK